METGPRPPGISVPWTWLTISLIVIASASLATLAVVVSVNDVDTLSTVALALAVLAFAAQLIVSLAQAQGSAQQLTQTEQINSKTQAALADVRSTAHALLTNQSEQFNKVLSAALRSVTESAVLEATESADSANGQDGGSLDPELIASRVESKLRDVLSQSIPSPSLDNPTSSAQIPDWMIEPLLPEETEAAFLALRNMSAFEIVDFTNRISRARRLGGVAYKPSDVPSYPMSALVQHGLYRWKGRPIITELGRNVARLLYSDMRFTRWYRSQLEYLRAEGGKSVGGATRKDLAPPEGSNGVIA